MQYLSIDCMPECFRDRLNGKPDPNAEQGFCIEKEHCQEFEEVCVFVAEGRPFATYSSAKQRSYKVTISQEEYHRIWNVLSPRKLPRECLMLSDLDMADGVSYLVRTVHGPESSRLIVSGEPGAYCEAEADAIAKRVVSVFQQAKELALPSSSWKSLFRLLR
jgi:hypothetical protein